MESPEQQRQRRIAERTQRRYNRLLRQMMRAKLRKRASNTNDINDVYEDLVARSIARMFTRSLTMDALTQRLTLTTTTTEAPSSETDVNDNMCHDIRGRDRACCNTALACFDDVANVIDDLQHAPNDYTLLTACRQVSEELKRDRVCVKQGLSACAGTGKAVLQRRFDSRINNLYDQFFKHCRGRTVAPSTTTTVANTTPLPPITTTQPGETPAPPLPPVTAGPTTSIVVTSGPGTYTNSPADNHPHTGASAGIDSSAIIIGAATGGVILIVLLIIAFVLWCRTRKDRYDSDSSSSSMGVFFQKRPSNYPPTERPRSNNKPGATRQDSTVYAEIDESIVHPGYKPPLPSDISNAGYLHPIGDEEDTGHYTTANTGSGPVTMATTRGQMSYGPILAANSSNSMTDSSLFYYSTTLTPPVNRQAGRELPQIPGDSNNNGDRSLFNAKPPLRKDNSYVEVNHDSGEELDEYEEPVSAQNSVKYSTVDTSPPYEAAPGIPGTPKTPENKHHKMAIKVLPSIPLDNSGLKPVSNVTANPIAKPRRQKLKTEENGYETPEENNEKVKSLHLDFSKLGGAGDRDSTISENSVKSSHHYYVLEKEPDSAGPTPDSAGLAYENSVSSSKLV